MGLISETQLLVSLPGNKQKENEYIDHDVTAGDKIPEASDVGFQISPDVMRYSYLARIRVYLDKREVE